MLLGSLRSSVVCALLVSTVFLSLAGCDSGPPRFDVTGTVTYEGQPVPLGDLTINADSSKGNKGPQGRAEIRDGQIIIQRGMGTVGGPVWIQVGGYDGKEFKDHEGVTQIGKELFPRSQAVIELPRDDVELNIQVKRAKAKGQKPEVDVQVVE